MTSFPYKINFLKYKSIYNGFKALEIKAVVYLVFMN